MRDLLGRPPLRPPLRGTLAWLGEEPAAFSHMPLKGSPHTFGDLAPATASEILTDLEAVIAK
ncbi:hypothetical protein ACQP1V_17525 [Microtetraspora malaysiensis]|uniref:hypothetical protein n=1 Tax=Microtetraspora malaysiensis TaxID=161358 RepID=UPI003D8A824F